MIASKVNLEVSVSIRIRSLGLNIRSIGADVKSFFSTRNVSFVSSSQLKDPVFLSLIISINKSVRDLTTREKCRINLR